MRVEHLRRDRVGHRIRASARVSWEDSEVPALDLYFEAEGPPGEGLSADPNSFLLAAILPAFRRQERRVWIEGTVCPRLRDGLWAAMGILRRWYEPKRRMPLIEASGGFQSPERAREPRRAVFLTGGVDSVHSLWRNRQMFPRDHPASFRDAIYVSSLAFPEAFPSERTRRHSIQQRRAIDTLASDSGIGVIAVTTNVRQLDRDGRFTAREGLSSVLASVAHLFSRSLTSVVLAASYTTGYLIPAGTHPLLDPCYSSSALEFIHDWNHWTRIEKLRQISSWQTGLDNLIVCFEGASRAGGSNCGKCEKCLRTMTALLLLGALDRCASFEVRRIDAKYIQEMTLGYNPFSFVAVWPDFLEPLIRCGRTDLARAISAKIRRARLLRLWDRTVDRVRRFDREQLKGTLRIANRKLHGWPAPGASP